ncbi:histidine kinase [Hypericibacter sp.]|uniref:PAS domain-containing sensor histidine kinase n=1 Tax=Hypericibacter sp. TaxID=2705401 RepID=UPI003D6CF243
MPRTPTTVTRPPAEHQAPAPDSDLFLQRTIDALSPHIAILGEAGEILMVNRAWREFTRGNEPEATEAGLGHKYLDVCRAAAGIDDQAWQIHEGITALLSGGRSEFHLDYGIDAIEGRRRFALRATRLAGAGPTRVVIAHEDVTQLERADDRLRHLLIQHHTQEDETRRHLARELHDVTAQKLVAACLLIAKADRVIGDDEPAISKSIAEARTLMEESLSEIRSLSYLFHPPLLEELGLAAAMRAYLDGFGQRTAIAMQAEIASDLPRLMRAAEMAFYRVLQEALGNVYRHAKSPVVIVRLYRHEAKTRLEVEDRGIGITGAMADGRLDPARAGVGLLAMKMRMEQIGGDIEVRTGAGGTRVCAVLPDRAWAGSLAPVSPARK